jgi:hypothetical protein
MSKREDVLNALKNLVADAYPIATVKRNLTKPERVESVPMVIVRDGNPGDPEAILSPLIYLYEHLIPLEIAVPPHEAMTPEETLDQVLVAIGTAIEANRTLGGLCDFVHSEAPDPEELDAVGVAPGRWVTVNVIAVYSTTNPLT